MSTIHADTGRCGGNALCMGVADDYFDVDDDGVVVVLKEEFPEADRAKLQEAVEICPVSALRIDA